MGRKEVLATRRALEDYYYNCKLETPEQVAQLFETYTKLIWDHHQAGLVYDYYSDETTLNHEGSYKEVGGVHVTTTHTIPSFAAFPRNKVRFIDIFCVGNQEDGYKFGQFTTHSGVFAEGGFNSKGMGDGTVVYEDDHYTFCQCVVKKVNGRWVVTEEFLGSGEEVNRRRVAGARPFMETLLDSVTGEDEPPCCCEEECCCEESACDDIEF